MTKLERKPRCCWTAKAKTWAVFHHDGRNTPIKRGPSPCAARACFDWPVCRGHLQAWADANPLEVAKRRPTRMVRVHMRAETLEFDHVQITFATGGWRGYSIVFTVSPADALAIADWYDHNGDERSAANIRRCALEITMRGDPALPAVIRDLLWKLHYRPGPDETTSPQ